MRKALSLAVPLAVLVLLGVAFAAWEAKRTPDWRVALDGYIASRWLSTHMVRVRSVARARRPWNYDPEMGRPVTNDLMWQSAVLPLPPKQVRCVLLERECYECAPDEGEIAYQVVFVCHHSDALWKVGWVVHEGVGDPFSDAFQGRISSIGCDLELARFAPPHPAKPTRAPESAAGPLSHVTESSN